MYLTCLWTPKHAVTANVHTPPEWSTFTANNPATAHQRHLGSQATLAPSVRGVLGFDKSHVATGMVPHSVFSLTAFQITTAGHPDFTGGDGAGEEKLVFT